MDQLDNRIAQAQYDASALNDLLIDYLPLIKKQIKRVYGMPYDDMLSIAMMTFVGCVKQYTFGRGGFVAFMKISIRNRLLDEHRRERRFADHVVSLPEQTEEMAFSDAGAVQSYDLVLERVALSDEIDRMTHEFASFHITFEELSRICPKQNRARRLCAAIADALVSDENIKAELVYSHRLPQSALATLLHISPKTIEKHRKYIVAISIILMGDYPNTRAFLPRHEEAYK